MSSAIALMVTVGIGWVAYATVGTYTPDTAPSSPLVHGSTGEMWLQVMGSNMPVFIGLLSGLASFGLGSLLTGASTALFVGATLSVTSNSIGWSALLGNSSLYALLEFSALVVAAMAGLLPAVAVMRSALLDSRGDNHLELYIHRSSVALVIAGCAAGLLATAAYIEALMMTGAVR